LTSSNESGLPRRFRQTSYAVLEIRDGGGIMMLFGLLFLLAGAAIVAPFSGLLPLQLAPDGKWTQFGFVLMGLAFVIVGTVFVFGRQWLTIDLSRGLVVVQYGVLVPMRTRQRSLSEFSGVSLRRVRGDSESVDRFPVQFHARTGHHFTISRPSNFGEARQQAEYLARWLRLPLTDETTDRGTTVAAQHAGDSLRERFQAETAEAAAPQPPQRMRSQVFESDREVKIVIPGQGNVLARIVAVFFRARHAAGVLSRAAAALAQRNASTLVPASSAFRYLHCSDDSAPGRADREQAEKDNCKGVTGGPRNRAQHAMARAGEDPAGGPDRGCRFQHLRRNAACCETLVRARGFDGRSTSRSLGVSGEANSR
jgi:hypothetical protein